MQLRDYQIKDIKNIREAFASHRFASVPDHRILFRGATGSGKTVMFADMATKSARIGNRVCIIVHRRELLDQIVKRIDEFSNPLAYGVIASGVQSKMERCIQIATIQTLVRRDYKDKFDFIIIDEAHHALASQYLKVINGNPKAKILGVTATPCRMQGYGLGDLFTRFVEQSLSIKELIEAGYLSKPLVYAPSMIDVSDITPQAGDYNQKELEFAASSDRIVGDAVEYYKALAPGRPAIAFCVSVKHAMLTAERFQSQGIAARCIYGDLNKATRSQYISGLASGDIKVLTSCDLISEGLDVPVVSCGIMLRPTHSLALALQQMGRILRPSPGKTDAIILDHAGNCLRHGMPQQDRVWTLDKRTKHGPNVRDEIDVNVRQCPICYYVHESSKMCMGCGYEYQPEDRVITKAEGKLQLLKEKKARALSRKTEVRKARTRSALETIAERRGYQYGWVNMILRSRGQAG